MATKTLTIKDMGIVLPAFDLDVDWSYSFTPGKYSGDPDDCYPDDEMMDADAIDLNGVVDKLLSDPRLRKTIYCAIEDHVSDLVSLGEIRRWAKEAEESAIEDRAEAAYQDQKERGM